MNLPGRWEIEIRKLRRPDPEVEAALPEWDATGNLVVWLAKRLNFFLFFAEEEAVNIRPEFLGNVVQCGGFQLRSPN